MDDGSEHTLESIGRRLKISRERVRQIQSEAIERISRIAAEQDPTFSALPVGRPSKGPLRTSLKASSKRLSRASAVAGAAKRSARVKGPARRDRKTGSRRRS